MVVISSAADPRESWWILPSTAALLIWSFLVAAGCQVPETRTTMSSRELGTTVPAEDFARQVVALIAVRDIHGLAEQIEPNRGLTFSPYGYVEVASAVILSPSELVQAWAEDKTFTWGRYDGSSELIALPIRDYFEQFVYDKDFRAAPQVAVGRVLARGNTRLNHSEVFPDATVVEFHVRGTDPRYAGMDWASLRCVLAPSVEGGWGLIGLVHDQWTI